MILLPNTREQLFAQIINLPIMQSQWPELGFEISVKPIKATRSNSQNNAIHRWCHMQAILLNDYGFERHVYFELLRQVGYDIPWSQETVKEHIWRIVQIAMYDKESTTALHTDEVGEVHKNIVRIMNQMNQPCVDFPSMKGIFDS